MNTNNIKSHFNSFFQPVKFKELSTKKQWAVGIVSFLPALTIIGIIATPFIWKNMVNSLSKKAVKKMPSNSAPSVQRTVNSVFQHGQKPEGDKMPNPSLGAHSTSPKETSEKSAKPPKEEEGSNEGTVSIEKNNLDQLLDSIDPEDLSKEFDELFEEITAYISEPHANNEYVLKMFQVVRKIFDDRTDWSAFFNKEPKPDKQEIIREVANRLTSPTHAETTEEIKPAIEGFPVLLIRSFLYAREMNLLPSLFSEGFKNTACVEAKYRILNGWLERQLLSDIESVTFECNPEAETTLQIFGNAIGVFQEIKARELFEKRDKPRLERVAIGAAVAAYGITLPTYGSEEWDDYKAGILKEKDYYRNYFTKESFIEFLKEKLPLPMSDKNGVPTTGDNLEEQLNMFIDSIGYDPFSEENGEW